MLGYEIPVAGFGRKATRGWAKTHTLERRGTPGRSIMDLKARDVMNPRVVTVRPELLLPDLERRLGQ